MCHLKCAIAREGGKHFFPKSRRVVVALTKQVAERSAKLRRTQDESGLDRFAARRIDFGDMESQNLS